MRFVIFALAIPVVYSYIDDRIIKLVIDVAFIVKILFKSNEIEHVIN